LNVSSQIELGKKKLSRFKELESLERVFQPPFEEVFHKDYPLKGKWKQQVFRQEAPLVLELGCGKGEYTVGLARLHPERNYMGLDIKGARIWTGARLANEEGLSNVVFLRTRIDIIDSFFTRDEVDELWITFPDPQEKKRRLKKRLTGAFFLNLYRKFLKDQGLIHLKTDNMALYSHTLELARFNKLEIEVYSEDLYQEGWMDPATSIQTYYETQFRKEGARIKYLRFRLPVHQPIKDLPDDI